MKPTHILTILALTFVLAHATPCGAQQYNFTTLAGPAGGAGYADGTGSDAQFSLPSGVAVDGAGNVYVADTHNQTIRKITPTGVVSTLAGLAGSPGSSDGRGSAARFAFPLAVAADTASNIYVADGDSTIRKITPGGLVSTLAGKAGSSGSVDGTGSAARFNDPYGVAVDSAGNVYVTDVGNGNAAIRKITPDGVVSTLAGGLAGNFGSKDKDGTGANARFSFPSGVAVDSAGNVYVADRESDTIRKITPSGVVSTLAGLAGKGGSDDGTGSAARFGYPLGVAVDSAGSVYVADTGNRTIRKVTPTGVVTTLAGLAGISGSADGTGSAARFDYPTGVAVDSAGNVYVTDTYSATIRKVTLAGVVSTLAGLAGGGYGSADAPGSAARFALPTGVAVDSTGNVYVADFYNSTIRKITPAGVVSTLAGLAGSIGSDDGTGRDARFRSPSGVAVDSAGSIYVADTENHTIRKVTPAGVVTTLAGLSQDTSGGGSPDGGSADGTGRDARFRYPFGVAVDSVGNVYVGDTENHTIRKVTPGGAVSTLAGQPGESGDVDGTGSAARFYEPAGVAVDSTGNVYVADSGSITIRKITPGGAVSTLAGQPGEGGDVDGTGSAARFSPPQELNAGLSGVAVDSAGNVYVADTFNSKIRRITPDGVVSTLAGQSNYRGSADGTGSAARFTWPRGMAVDSAGNIYVADTWANNIRMGTRVLVTLPRLNSNSLLQVPNEPFQFEVTGSTNQLVFIQAASVLPATDWNTIQTVTLWNGGSTITDPGASDFPLRFYRAISPVP